jgi:Holliday junction resolvase RusA-like endonuclease
VLQEQDALPLAGITCRQPITITLPGEPVAKGRPRFTKTGHAFTPAKSRNYEHMLRVVAGQVMRSRPPLQGPVLVTLEAHLPIPTAWSKKKQRLALSGHIFPTTRPDLDNLLKGAADACNGIVWRDDKQIVEAKLTKRYSDRPRLTLIVAELAQDTGNS